MSFLPGQHFGRKIILLLFFSLLPFFSFAQPERKANGNASISGRIIDSVSSQPIEYATISLVTEADNKTVNGTTTNNKGVFTLTGVAPGKYKLLIYFIGYQIKTEREIEVGKDPDVILGDVKLANKQANLKEVTVTTEKSIIENKIDKMVYNVDKDVTSQSGVAADVLKKVPQVSVDVNGNVELQGSSSIRFLINGKPSIIFGNNIADVLQSIPANQIQSIEVITSPGAKYDAEGTGGIINIILKKSTAEGISGTISLSGGSRLENGSANLNAHHKHLGINAFISGNAQLPSVTLINMHRTSHDDSLKQSSELIQNGTSDFSRQGFESGAGFDWEINSKNDLSGSVGFDYFSNTNNGMNDRQTIFKDSTGAEFYNMNDRTTTLNSSSSHSLDWGLNYKKTFKKEDQELNISCESSNGKNYSYYVQAQKYLSPDSIYSGSYGNNPGSEKETALSIDYAQPLGQDAMLEAGAKTVLNEIRSISNVYLLKTPPEKYDYSSTQSSSLNYKSYVYAGYLSTTFKLFDWLNVKTGLRYEYTEPHAYFSNAGNVLVRSYGTYVPSAVISHSFKKEQTLKLSYTHRIERPEYRDLNPFINASDPRNITTGNTGLRPEVGDKIELGYSKIFEKRTTMNLTLFFRGNKDDIQSFTKFYSDYTVGDSVYHNVSVSTRENIGRENNFGLNLFASVRATTKMTFRTNISCFQRYIINGVLPGNNVQGFNYRINLNAAYEINENFSIELFGNFNSPKINAQGKMPSFTTYNFALRKQFFKKKASLAITATNIFNKYIEQKTELTGESFTIQNVRELPYRSFGINFTYKFGKIEFKREKEMDDPNLTGPPGN